MLSKISIDIINSLTISELDALRFIDNNPKSILKWSIKELSEATFVSTATIMRLCKKLGYSGFSELKYHLREEINLAEEQFHDVSFKEIINQNLKTLIDTSALIEEEKVMALVDLMLKPVNIHFFGKGLTASVLNYASKLLLTCHRANFIYQDTHIAYLTAESMTKNDLLFVCSLSGKTHQVIRMAQIAKSRNATVVTISSNKDSELSKIGDYNFSVCESEFSIKKYDISSRLPIFFLLIFIITIYISKKE